jgi:hypothetical protein
MYLSVEPVEALLKQWIPYGYTEWSWARVGSEASIVFKMADRARMKTTLINLELQLQWYIKKNIEYD